MCAWQGACATDMLVLALVTSLGTVLLPARGFLRRLTLANQRRGGEGPRRDEARSQGVPERSRRAQRAQRACPNQGACPAPRRTSVQAQPHRLRSKRDAMRRPGAAGGCAAAVLGQRVRGRPVPKGMQELNQLHKCPGLRRNPWRWYEPAGPTGDRHDAHVASREHVHHHDGASASPTGAGTARRGHRREKLRAEARCWYLFRGIKNGCITLPWFPALLERGPSTPKGAAPRPNPTNHPRRARPL